jgi:hypothetical protein
VKTLILLAILAVAVYWLMAEHSDSACYDDAAHLWNDAISDNRYEGNERYWDAIARCNQ